MYYFWSVSRKSVTAEDSSQHTSEEIEEIETEKDQLVDTNETYLSEDNESFEILSYEVELGLHFNRVHYVVLYTTYII